MKIENKEMLLYSAGKAINAVGNTGGTHPEEKEAYFIIGTAIHWIVDCIDRIPKKIIKDEHRKLFSAIRCANNCLKHNVTFKEAHQEQGLDFLYDFSYDYGIYYIWGSLDEVYIQESKENQRKNYKEKLEGENVLSTLSTIFEVVKEYYAFL